MKKTLALVLTAALLMGSLSACGSSNKQETPAPETPVVTEEGTDAPAEEEADAPVAEAVAGDVTDKIVVAVPEGDFVSFMNEKAVPKFNEKYPNVTVEVISDKEIDTQISAGNTPNVYTGGFGARGMRYAQAGVLVPLNNFQGYDDIMGRVDDNYVTQFDDYNFYVPWTITTTMMVYNKELFAQAGLDPENPPKTMEEFLKCAEAIDNLGPDIYGTCFWNIALAWGGWYWDMLAPIYYNFNGGQYQLMNSTGTDIVFDKPEAKMADFMQFLVDAQKFAPPTMDDDNSFFKRNVGMWLQFGYGWKANMKGAADHEMEIGKDIGIAPIPVLNEGDTPYSTLGGNGLIIFKSDEQKQNLSWEFIKVLMEDELNLDACKLLGQLPSLTSLQGNEYFQQVSEMPFVNQTLTAIQPEPFGEADTIANHVLQTLQAVVVDGGTSIEDALPKLAEDARAEIK